MNYDFKKALAGLSIIAFGTFIGRETIVYAWGKALDFVFSKNLFFNFKNELDLQKTASLIMIILGIIIIILSSKKDDTADKLYKEASHIKNSIESLRTNSALLRSSEFKHDSEEKYHESMAFLDLIRKYGFQTPILSSDLHVTLYIIHNYIIQLSPYLSKELFRQGKQKSLEFSMYATKCGEKFKPEDWFYK